MSQRDESEQPQQQWRDWLKSRHYLAAGAVVGAGGFAALFTHISRSIDSETIAEAGLEVTTPEPTFVFGLVALALALTALWVADFSGWSR